MTSRVDSRMRSLKFDTIRIPVLQMKREHLGKNVIPAREIKPSRREKAG